VSIALVAALGACGGESATGPSDPTTPVGSYTMTTVNGKGLPASLFADGGFNYEVTSGNLALTADGKFSAVTTFRQTLPGSVENFTDSIGGTWVQSGSNLQITNATDGTAGSATWGKGVLTLTNVDAGVTTTVVYALKK